MEKLPQKLVNIRASDRSHLSAAMASAPVQAAIGSAEHELAGRGRVLVRASGTEPLVRVMVEAPSLEETEAQCRRLAAVVEAALGG
jgi:phosphoglucosamine mutase